MVYFVILQALPHIDCTNCMLNSYAILYANRLWGLRKFRQIRAKALGYDEN